MRKALRTLRGYAGRVMRDIRRQLDAVPGGAVRDTVLEMLARVSKLLHQAPKSRGKIYALHEPDVDGISKGKARVRYEFGCKVSIATTIDEGFVVGMRAMPGNPYDGHTLAEALEQVETLTDCRPELAVVARGYRGHGVTSYAPLYDLYKMLYWDNHDSFMKIVSMAYKTVLGLHSDLSPDTKFSHSRAEKKAAPIGLKGLSTFTRD